jgi:hypothetical protein
LRPENAERKNPARMGNASLLELLNLPADLQEHRNQESVKGGQVIID